MAKNKVEIVGIDTSKLKSLKKDELINLLNEYHNGNIDVFIKECYGEKPIIGKDICGGINEFRYLINSIKDQIELIKPELVIYTNNT